MHAGLLSSMQCESEFESQGNPQSDSFWSDFALEACETSFVVDGSFFCGRTFRASGEAPGVNTSQAVQRIAQALALQSMWRDVRADRDIGTVTASLTAVGNDAAVSPLNIVVQDANGGASMRAVFSARAGLMVQLEPLRDLMCSALAAAANPSLSRDP